MRDQDVIKPPESGKTLGNRACALGFRILRPLITRLAYKAGYDGWLWLTGEETSLVMEGRRKAKAIKEDPPHGPTAAARPGSHIISPSHAQDVEVVPVDFTVVRERLIEFFLLLEDLLEDLERSSEPILIKISSGLESTPDDSEGSSGEKISNVGKVPESSSGNPGRTLHSNADRERGVK